MHSLYRLRLLLECLSKFLGKVLIFHFCLSVKQPMILLQVSIRFFEIRHDLEILPPLFFLDLLHVFFLQLLHLPLICLLLNLLPLSLILEDLKHPLVVTSVVQLEGFFRYQTLVFELNLGQF